MRRAALAAWLVFAFSAGASAQYARPPGWAPTPAAPDLFTRTSFHLFATKLATGDRRFGWDTHFGGDLDVVDYRAGRLVLLVDYNAVIGSELRAIDPNQGNYTLEPSLSLRTPAAELALVFHHVSRHLGDRAKTFALDWNVLGARAMRRLAVGGATADLAVGAGRFVQHSFVDYTWTANADLLLRRPIGARVGAFARASGETFGTDRSLYGRGRQSGGSVEGGVHVRGAGGAVELFAGVERRVDADAIGRTPGTWAIAGFRFLSR
ncbi:MAG: hypothetical protein IT176_09340 [Acidobacteria bacterium]|nr:hypothetical protein [Acidobacteriota bacterium]